MPKPKEPESFDVAGTRYKQHEDPRASLEQAFHDYVTSIPSRNFSKKINGDLITIYCHAHERALDDPKRMALQIDAMSKAMDQFVKGLKKRYKEYGAGTLSISEEKGGRGYDVQRVSLNDRYEVVYRRTYRFGKLIGLPEEE